MNRKNMTIGKKIAFGFGIVLMLLCVVGILSFTGVKGIVNNAAEVIDGNKLDANLTQKEVDHLIWAEKVGALLTDEKVTTLEVQTDDRKCAFGQWLYGEGRQEAERLVPSLAPLFASIETPHRELHASAVAIGQAFQQADLKLGQFLQEKKTDHLMWTHKIKDAFVDVAITRIDVETDPHKCSLGKWMYSSETLQLKKTDPEFAEMWANVEKPHRHLHASAIDFQKMLGEGRRDEARTLYMQKTEPWAHECLANIDHIINWHDTKIQGMQKANDIYAHQTIPALGATRKLLKDIRAEAKKHIMTDAAMLNAAQGTKRNVTLVGSLAVAIGIVLAYFLARGIVVVLTRLSTQLGEGADQVASASSQVSAASQSLAEGASEQAASIEETSSSIEEMAAMTQQNAGNANQANGLMADTNQVVAQANASMDELTLSMAEISQAGEETQKIVKTIDEIAFQTNLLALNAAVEAARAGEAGAGFAVVADEVRNLAMRAAEAAKDTAALIEGTVKKVGDGSALVKRTNDAFTKVAESAAKVGDLVDEISAASGEQAHGIDQVNTAISQMGEVTQQNAANAEESASASEELSAQAEQMQTMVGELLALVSEQRSIDTATTNAQARPGLTGKTSRPRAKAALSPAQAIPFDGEKTFNEF